MTTTDVPPLYRDLVDVWGPALGVEEARGRFSDLVERAEQGTTTLIARDAGKAYDWCALAPLTELAVPLGQCPVWSLVDARQRLGEVVTAAAPFASLVAGTPQILTRHRKPVAAVLAALTLVERPSPADRLDRLSIEQLLLDGGTVLLEYDPGDPGSTDPDGEVDQPPQDPGFTAVARDRDGVEVGGGFGQSIPEALLRLHRTGTPDYAVDPAHYYSTEPPLPEGTTRTPSADPWAHGWSAPADPWAPEWPTL